MATINYMLLPSYIRNQNNNRRFRASVLPNAAVDIDDLASALAEKTKESQPFMRYVLSMLSEELKEQLCEGNRVSFGHFRIGLNIRGSFEHDDDPFDPQRHAVFPEIRLDDEMKKALMRVDKTNLTHRKRCFAYSCMDAVTHGLNEICVGHEIHIQGVGMGIDPANDDEGISLLDDSGNVLATARHLQSNPQIIRCIFDQLPLPGEYIMRVSSRNGRSPDHSPSVSKLSVAVTVQK